MMSRSGVGLDDSTHTVVTDDGVWEELVKEFPMYKKLKRRKWPYYHRWVNIFRQDRACGADVQFFNDACQHLEAMLQEDTEPGRGAHTDNDSNCRRYIGVELRRSYGYAGH
ncbi:hypothetical protein M569_05109 [Genlisea aurea]|uniref:Uncharacterized protein n=1 Tax=Genlisea aurea TaxID=192259 RepID=S8CXC8_9LAMI|nr:hypothetical protein M569_05109 [Genlisea aurea]